jgi:polyhydroxybutyrate depolymerase
VFPTPRYAAVLLAIVACGAKHDAATGDAAPTIDASTPADAASFTGDAAACGMRTGMRGVTQRTVMVGSAARTYLVYLPASGAATAMPFVFVFHGYTMSGQEMYDLTQYAALADSEGIALAFPDGEGGPDSLDSPWNVENPGQVVCGAGQDVSATGDDFAFMDAIRADVTQDQCIDAAHVFVTGFSMGGYFTEHVGCYRSDIRGLAPHSGGTLADLTACTTGRVPIILFHGLADSVIDDACDDPSVTPDQGFTAAATLWAAKNGCAATYQTVVANGSGGGSGQCRIYDNCPADGQVELCTFDAMDHCWAGGATAGAAGNSCPTYASATQLEWSFFKQYAW